MSDQLSLPLESDGAPVKRGRGRPRVHATDADRKAAYRERKRLVQLTVSVSAEVAEAFDSYVQRQMRDGAGLSKQAVIEKLLRTQVLRKR